MKNKIFECLPENICKMVESVYCERMEEVRLRCGKPLSVFMDGACFMVGENGFVSSEKNAYIVTKSDVDRSFSAVTDGSFYAYENEIKNGYVTIDGGNRVGLGGRGAEDENKNICIREIFSLNFRFARQIKGCGAEAAEFIRNGKKIYNTVIVSPPGCGKTTLLREIAKIISNFGIKVCVIDERDEICAASGENSYDVGINTDVYTGFSKKDAVNMAIRCLSPQVIIADELGENEDFEAVCRAAMSGVASICSIHATCFADLAQKHEKIQKCFDRFIILGYDKKIKQKALAGELDWRKLQLSHL